MDKLVLLSVVLATISIPVIGARYPEPVKGLWWSCVAMAGFIALYLAALLLVWPRLL